jgi:serine phosphatase RsbU (regulator of sigma subunit)
LFLAAMLAILITRYMRTRKDEERYKREREAAQIVQQVLIPEEIPAIPGFSIQSVYKPFGEVGGDFFQIVPTCNGGALIAIGDVSGKGLPAAMTVSLLVGTFRTLARYTQEPGEILSAMNVRMLARSNGGFTTCLVLRADLDGRVTIANAGHIAPYVNGNEISLDSGLPLGLSAETVYQESAISLVQHDRLTLVTDGVVEARSKTGELFGFERMQTIVHQDAEFIARIAQEFGQDDDITAVSLSYTPLTAAA